MSNNEDYLDSLLNSVTKKLSEFDDDFEQKKESAESARAKKNLPPKTMKAIEAVRENQFLRDFEDELQEDFDEDDVDAFLADFEAELDGEAQAYVREQQQEEEETTEAYLEQVNEIVSQADEETELGSIPMDEDVSLGDLENFTFDSDMELPDEEMDQVQPEPPSQTEDDVDLSLDLFGEDMLAMDDEPVEEKQADAFAQEDLPAGMEDLESLFAEEDHHKVMSDAGEEESLLPENEELTDEGIMELLNGLSDEDEALADIGKMLEADENDIQLEDISADPENLSQAASLAAASKDEKPKKEKKNGFWSKLMNLLFGEDEDDEEDDDFEEDYDEDDEEEKDPDEAFFSHAGDNESGENTED